jgi:hypothetical protein
MHDLDSIVIGMSMAGPAIMAAVVAAVLAKAFGAERQIGVMAIVGALVGASVGYLEIARAVQPSLPSFGDLMPGLGEARDEAELERVLKTYYPSDYLQVRNALDDLKSGQTSQADAQRVLRTIGFPLMLRQLPQASTENTVAYLAITREEQALLAKDPYLCERVINDPGPDTVRDVAAVMPDQLRRREAHLAIQILEQTATHPQPPSPKPDTDREMDLWATDAADGLSFEERDAMRMGGSEGHAAAECKVFGNLLYTLSMDYAPDAAEVYKAMLAKGASRFAG